ncbi:hypothetical protein [Polymorphospora sp. NPDC050346]|uniref:hypothetical protein n=1 Tax=Polymorphospora sp. NPDC050346 TaxID=3155780 RepID=UPI0033D24A38
MAIDRRRLPHGTTLPTTLTEPDALALVAALAQHFGWTYALYSSADIQEQLTDPRRTLTPDEWDRVQHTAAWTTVPTTLHRAAGTTELIADTIRQAALECAKCDAPLTGPPTATWGHCPACLTHTTLEDLRERPCPATGTDAPHNWPGPACTACGIPRPPIPHNRRLRPVA